MPTKFKEAILRIDAKNAKDPNKEVSQGKEVPKELLYAQRMSSQLEAFCPESTDALKIAVRAQHICRWEIDRKEYPATRVGYLKWRNELKKMHAQITTKILEEVGYDQAFIDRVSFLIQKKKIKKDEGSQALEDVICLVFLEYYLTDFAAKHEDQKILDIIKKTWTKMSKKGQVAALNLKLDPRSMSLVQKALS